MPYLLQYVAADIFAGCVSCILTAYVPCHAMQDAVFRGAGVEDSSQPTGALERFKKRKTEG